VNTRQAIQPTGVTSYNAGDPSDTHVFVYYAGMIDPTPLIDPLDDFQLLKSETTYGSTEAHDFTLQDGKIHVISVSFSGITQTKQLTFVYESKQ